MSQLEMVDRLRLELANAEIALDDAAASVQELPWWFRLRAADARDVLLQTTPPAGTARRWADVPKDW